MHDLIRRRPKMSLKLDRVVEIHSPWSTSSRYNKISMKEVNNIINAYLQDLKWIRQFLGQYHVCSVCAGQLDQQQISFLNQLTPIINKVMSKRYTLHLKGPCCDGDL